MHMYMYMYMYMYMQLTVGSVQLVSASSGGWE